MNEKITKKMIYRFDDLLDIRLGEPGLYDGAGNSWIGKIGSAEQWEIKASALRDLFNQTLGWQPEIPKDTQERVLSETNRGDHILRVVEFSVDRDERICGYVLIPKILRKPAPAMICIPPTKSKSKDWVLGNVDTLEGHQLAYAKHLVQKGYVTFVYEWIGAGDRAFKGVREFDTGPFYDKYPQWSARGKDIWDAERVLDVLSRMSEVDASRIGAIGHSQGGGISIHLAAVDERVKVAVSSCGLCPQRLSKNPYNEARNTWWVGRPALRAYCLTGKLFPVDMHENIAMIAPRGVFLSTAINDFQYHLNDDSHQLKAGLIQMAGEINKVFALYHAEDKFKSILHEGGHGFGDDQREQAYMFIDSILRRDEE
jgi:dienelactone hydrolase